MKVAKKLIAALVVGVCVVLAVFGWIRVQRETKLFDADVRRDHRAVAMTLASSVETVWRTSGEQEALSLVRAADRSKAHIRIRWIWLDQGTTNALLDSASFARLRTGELVQQELRVLEHDGHWTPGGHHSSAPRLRPAPGAQASASRFAGRGLADGVVARALGPQARGRHCALRGSAGVRLGGCRPAAASSDQSGRERHPRQPGAGVRRGRPPAAARAPTEGV